MMTFFRKETVHIQHRALADIILSIESMRVVLSAVRGETTSDTPPSCEFTNTSALEKWVMPTSMFCSVVKVMFTLKKSI